MLVEKRVHPPEKNRLHPRNRHRERYDFPLLTQACPELADFLKMNIYDDVSVDFADPAAVKMLNTALLKQYYDLNFWDIPPGYLCPPIPGRADYIHHIADVLAGSNQGIIPTGPQIRCLDVGVGANCIYPIIGRKEYGWSFLGSDVDRPAIQSAEAIVAANDALRGAVTCQWHPNPNNIFVGVIAPDKPVDLSICNPPFYASADEAQTETLRKQRNLSQEKVSKSIPNFGGQNRELWYPGGEVKFIQAMIAQSRQLSSACLWFSSLVAKQNHLPAIYHALKIARAADVKTIEMGQGNKTSRIVAWSFLNQVGQRNWSLARWQR